jgi:hypothetical protein
MSKEQLQKPSRLSAIDAAKENAKRNERKAKAYYALAEFLRFDGDSLPKDVEELILFLCCIESESYYS